MEHKLRLTPRCCANRTPAVEGLQEQYRRVAGNSQKSYPSTIKKQIALTTPYETSNSAPGVFLASFSSKVKRVHLCRIAVADIKASPSFKLFVALKPAA